MSKQAAYGTWHSTLSAKDVAAGSIRYSEPVVNSGRTFWLEGRANEKGRTAIVMQAQGSKVKDVLPAPWSARAKVHEYGGGAYCVEQDNVYFIEASNGQICHLDISAGAITQITATPDCRYGGLVYDSYHQRLLAVCEQHEGPAEPANSLVAVSLNGKLTTLAEGDDFYAQPALSPCGRRLSFISWCHPNMPWDESTLWVAELAETGEVGTVQAVPVTTSASVFQPCWLNSEELIFACDANNWWNLYQWNSGAPQSPPRPLYEAEAEFATPLWSLGMRTYGLLNENTLFVTSTAKNHWHAGLLARAPGDSAWRYTSVPLPLCSIQDVFTSSNTAAFVASGTTAPAGVYLWREHNLQRLAQNTQLLKEGDISRGQPFSFPTSNGHTAYANFYAPQNSLYKGEPGTQPPAIFLGHGGPTGQTDLGLAAKIQYWTTRGFAVVDVNYRGSTGYGRQYRNLLRGQWGIYDVEDVCNAAKYCAEKQWVHPDQCIIRGSSAGGFTVLAALTDSDTFNAGVSLYGIGDLEMLATDTHKFESRYLDSLIGPYPEQKTIYQQRSPLHKANQITCPVAVFQGLDDKVVPPNQAEGMVHAIRAQGTPVVYVTYPGEAHGFRKAETVINQLETEYAFYKDVFDLDKEFETVARDE